MKKVFKILGMTSGVLFALLVILIAVIFYQLPSAKDINQYFKKDKVTQAHPQIQNEKGVTQAENIQSPNTAEHNTSGSTSSGVVNSKSNRFNQGLEDLMTEGRPVSEFCKKLNTARTGSLKIFDSLVLQEGENKKLTEADFDQFEEEDLEDLRLEAVRPVITHILKKPAMNKFVAMIMQVEDLNEEQKKELEESDSFLNKASFYAQAFQVYNEMKNNKSEYEAVMDRSYLMYKLNDLIALKPELQNDQRIRRYCEDSEQLLNAQTPVRFESEKEIFERLVSDLGVDPQQIKYDPHYKTKLDFTFSANNFQMSGGWLGELVPTSQKQ